MVERFVFPTTWKHQLCLLQFECCAWPIAASIRVVSSFKFINLITFLCCVMGTTEKALVHGGPELWDCFPPLLPLMFSNWSYIFPDFPFYPQKGREQILDGISFFFCHPVQHFVWAGKVEPLTHHCDLVAGGFVSLMPQRPNTGSSRWPG